MAPPQLCSERARPDSASNSSPHCVASISARATHLAAADELISDYLALVFGRSSTQTRSASDWHSAGPLARADRRFARKTGSQLLLSRALRRSPSSSLCSSERARVVSARARLVSVFASRRRREHNGPRREMRLANNLIESELLSSGARTNPFAASLARPRPAPLQTAPR